MFIIKKKKFLKTRRGRLKGNELKNNKLRFGNSGLQAIEAKLITCQQIETMRKILTRFLKGNEKFWIPLFPHKPITTRVAESRMGAGKGNIAYWTAVIKPNMYLFEILTNDFFKSKLIFKLIKTKLPLKTKYNINIKNNSLQEIHVN